MANSARNSGAEDDLLDDEIVDAAIALAEEAGWENVRLRTVAERLDRPLATVAARFRDLDAVADAWFARVRGAMLAPPPEGFADLPARDRLELVLWRWFEAASVHKRVSVQMLALKMWPFHPHHWVPMLFNLSRTILWLRDTAGCDARAPRRELEEVGLTWLFLGTLAVWVGDQSPDLGRTRAFLRARLAQADRLLSLIFGPEAKAWQPAAQPAVQPSGRVPT